MIEESPGKPIGGTEIVHLVAHKGLLYASNGYTPLDWTAYERMSESKAKLDRAERLRAKGGKSGAIETKR